MFEVLVEGAGWITSETVLVGQWLATTVAVALVEMLTLILLVTVAVDRYAVIVSV